MKKILEDHGFNNQLFLFGEANFSLIEWMNINTKILGGYVSNVHFTTSHLKGLAALISSDLTEDYETSLYFPDKDVYSILNSKSEKIFIESIIKGFSDQIIKSKFIEASFIGTGYHLDFVRGNFSFNKEENQIKFNNVLQSHDQISNPNKLFSKIETKIHYNKFFVKLNGTPETLISLSETGNIMFAMKNDINDEASHVKIDNETLKILNSSEKTLIEISYPELIQYIKALTSTKSEIHLVTYNDSLNKIYKLQNKIWR